MQKNVFASRTANLACRPSYSTVLLIYYFSILLQIQYCRGQCLGLTTRDAKKFSTYYHVLQQNVVFASRTANLACRPSYSTVLLFYYLLFHSRYSTAAADVWGWPPEMQKVFHVLPRTTTYCHVLQQNVGLHLGQPTLHAGPPILVFYELNILLFYSRYSTAAADVWGWPPEMRKKISTYHHVLQQNVVFASRTANLACRPSYSMFLLIYYFTFSLHARDAKKRFCISDGQPCMSALLFYCFTNLLFFYFAPDTVLPRPMFGVDHPRCKKVFHVLPRTTAERSFCISDGQPCMSALLFYCLTILLFTISLQIQYCRGRCLGLAARDAKSFPRPTTHHHVLPRTTAERRFASRTANLACRPSYSIFLRIKYFTILLQIQYCRGRCLGLAARDAKKFSTYYHVLPHTTTYYNVLPRTTAERSFCISDGQPCMSALLFYCFTILLFHSRYSTAAADVWGWPPEMQTSFPRTTTYYLVLPRTTTYYSRT